jgi:hypothetical protein
MNSKEVQPRYVSESPGIALIHLLFCSEFRLSSLLFFIPFKSLFFYFCNVMFMEVERFNYSIL